MGTQDPHRFSDRLDEPTAQRLILRLESRAKDAVFNRLLDQYVARLDLPSSTRVLEIGCGTGATIRTLVRGKRFSSRAVGVDQSSAFIEAAKRFAMEEGLGDRIEFMVGDAHDLHLEDGRFDVVLVHTLISHVTDPAKILQEAARLIRKQGSIAIFDGDYASLSYACTDRELGRKMDHALVSVTFNNPLIMRDLVRLLPQTGFEITETLANVVSEIGSASYFKSFADTYLPMVVAHGLVPAEEVERWRRLQESAMDDGTFFASCNYYTYLARRV